MQEHLINVNEDENASLTFEAFYKRFQKMTCSVKLRHSDQRETLLKVLFKTQKHLSAEEIQTLLKNEHRVGVSLATVYKQLLLLEMLDLASVVVTFPKKTKRYRLKTHLSSRSFGVREVRTDYSFLRSGNRNRARSDSCTPPFYRHSPYDGFVRYMRKVSP